MSDSEYRSTTETDGPWCIFVFLGVPFLIWLAMQLHYAATVPCVRPAAPVVAEAPPHV